MQKRIAWDDEGTGLLWGHGDCKKKTYKGWTAVRITDDSPGYTCCDKEYFRGRSGTVVMCYREENHRSQYVAVYVLLDKFKEYGTLVVVKRSPQSICKCREERQHTRHQTGWCTCRNFLMKCFWSYYPDTTETQLICGTSFLTLIQTILPESTGAIGILN